MKNIIYIILFGFLSALFVACEEKKQTDDKQAEQVADSPQKEEVVDNKKPAATNSAADGSESVVLGEKLVKTHCSSCHQSEMYTRAESKIKSADALLTQIKACDANLGTALFDEDMAAIAAYLEKNFYKFAN